MITSDERDIRAAVMPLEIMWQNPLTFVGAHLRVRELSDPDYRWAEPAKKIRARRANSNANHC